MKTHTEIIDKLSADIKECYLHGIKEYQRPPDCWLLFKNNKASLMEAPTGVPIAGFKSEQGLRKRFFEYYKGDFDICLVAYWLEE